MSAGRLVLHVGLPKAASSALQVWADANRAALAAQGVDYPDPRSPHLMCKHPWLVAELAEELGTSREAVVLAWLLRLPWGVRPVIGSQDPGRIAACAQAPAAAAALDSRRWHRLWSAVRGVSLP